jgi:hypothetical protein
MARVDQREGIVMVEKNAAGKNIVSYCTKCKLGLDHTIVAMDGELIVKVTCKTCGSSHKYKDPTAVKKPRTAKKKDSALKTAEALWETCLSEAKAQERVYIMTGRYRVGDVVLHDIFGKGIVRKLFVNKCTVLFKDKERLMASANH